MLRTSKEAYERAYDTTRNRGVRDLYGVLASSRIGMISELQEQLESITANDQFAGSRISRGWNQVWKEVRNPAWLLGDDAVLNTIYRSERRLLSVYDRNLLTQDLSEAFIDLLGRQRVQVLENVSNIELFLKSGFALADQ
ncbi:MAG: hypothetical protein ABIY71_07675 [Flavobacteriales bacterium]